MGGKNSYGPYNVTQGGVGNVVADPVTPTATGNTSGSEPPWPTTEYATVGDGGIVWTAIYARVCEGTVGNVFNQQVFQHDQTHYPDHYFQYGQIVFTSGGNIGLSCAVRDSGGVSAEQAVPYLFLLELMPNEILAGDTFEATVGCAKTRLACQQFNNFDNHRAFPDMPTEDRALQTPDISAQGYAPKQSK